jgi:hypothetical protein
MVPVGSVVSTQVAVQLKVGLLLELRKFFLLVVVQDLFVGL